MLELENINNINLDGEDIDILSGIAVITPKKPIYTVITDMLLSFFYDLGRSICEIIMDLIYGVLYFFGLFLGWFWTKTEKARAFLLGKLKYLGLYAASPFLRLFATFSRMRQEVRTANREYGMKGAIPAFLRNVFALVFGKRGAAVTVFNYAVPVISIIFLYNVVSYATSMDYAVRLEVNGRFVGYIENELVFTEAQKEFEKRLTGYGSTIMVTVSPQFTIEKVGYSSLLNASEVTNYLMETSGVSVELAYGIYRNEQLIGAVIDNSSIIATLEALLDAHRIGVEDEEVAFVENIDVTQGALYTTDSIVEPDVIIREFTATLERARYYIVAEGDSQSLISDNLGVGMAVLERLNPGFSAMELYVGDRIIYSAAVPALPVSITRTQTYEQPIAFSVEYRDDSTLFVGSSFETTSGVNGSELVTARVTLSNGVETGRTILTRQTLTLPVTKIVSQGTRAVPANIQHQAGSAEYGKFLWPLPPSTGKIVELHGSENWGYRNHSGIDIGAPYGTPVFAGGSGTIIQVGWNSGYGNCVTIEHSNGLRTLYSHMSAYVPGLHVGQEVSQGQNIAFVGSTGYAYGNHLHFEVLIGNTPVNPRYYLEESYFY